MTDQRYTSTYYICVIIITRSRGTGKQRKHMAFEKKVYFRRRGQKTTQTHTHVLYYDSSIEIFKGKENDEEKWKGRGAVDANFPVIKM